MIYGVPIYESGYVEGKGEEVRGMDNELTWMNLLPHSNWTSE